MQIGRARGGSGLIGVIAAAWLIAAVGTLAHRAATPRSIPTDQAGLEVFAPADSVGGSDASGGDTPVTPVEQAVPGHLQKNEGIRPPWHENFIPELRRQPGNKPRKTTA